MSDDKADLLNLHDILQDLRTTLKSWDHAHGPVYVEKAKEQLREALSNPLFQDLTKARRAAVGGRTFTSTVPVTTRFDTKVLRMGRRKRQVLFVLNKAYEDDKEDTKVNRGWRSRDYILAQVASLELGRKLEQNFSPLIGLILEIAPEPLKREYEEKKNTMLIMTEKIVKFAFTKSKQYKTTYASELATFNAYRDFLEHKLLPLRTSREYNKRWGSLRTSTYSAIRSLERDSLLERRDPYAYIAKRRQGLEMRDNKIEEEPAVLEDDAAITFRVTNVGRRTAGQFAGNKQRNKNV